MLNNLMHQSVIKHVKTGYDAQGRETTGVTSTLVCRFVEQPKSRLLPNQQIQVIDATMYIDGGAEIEINDKVVYEGNNYKVHAVIPNRGRRGTVHHTTCELIKYQI